MEKKAQFGIRLHRFPRIKKIQFMLKIKFNKNEFTIIFLRRFEGKINAKKSASAFLCSAPVSASILFCFSLSLFSFRASKLSASAAPLSFTCCPFSALDLVLFSAQKRFSFQPKNVLLSAQKRCSFQPLFKPKTFFYFSLCFSPKRCSVSAFFLCFSPSVSAFFSCFSPASLFSFSASLFF